jgi:DNA-binding transcriptional regulator YhcF (GntR family)
MQLKEKRQTRINGILSLIQHEPMNRRQLAMATGFNLATVDQYIYELKNQKLIYIVNWVRTSGQMSPYWQSGNKLSAERPMPQTQNEANRKYKAKHGKQTLAKESITKLKRDIAANWF